MNIDTLRLFFETVHRGSFAAVARDHAMDPSSVSRISAGLAYAGRVETLVDELERARKP